MTINEHKCVWQTIVNGDVMHEAYTIQELIDVTCKSQLFETFRPVDRILLDCDEPLLDMELTDVEVEAFNEKVESRVNFLNGLSGLGSH